MHVYIYMHVMRVFFRTPGVSWFGYLLGGRLPAAAAGQHLGARLICFRSACRTALAGTPGKTWKSMLLKPLDNEVDKEAN